MESEGTSCYGGLAGSGDTSTCPPVAEHTLQVVRLWAPVRDGNTSLRILKQKEQLDGP